MRGNQLRFLVWNGVVLFLSLLWYDIVLAQPSDDGPEMAAIRGGCFQMGSSDSEEGRFDDERLHRVCVRHFMIGKYAVTFDEYDRFVAATGRERPDDSGWGRGRRPVIHVRWNDAVAYAYWLSQRTGRHYRLPTEAEWEYAARAGTTTTYHWGNTVGCNNANCDGCSSQWAAKQTAPVGSFSPNPWGLYDMLGNVWQWTCSAYVNPYHGDEQRCQTSGAVDRVIRGGSWFLNPRFARAAHRSASTPTYRGYETGFRLVRTD